VTGTGAWRAARPALHTPKPQLNSVQSAMVVGPKGQEIHTDEFGRVRVQFPWDREGTQDDGSSCWIRVSQGWAGTGYGMINVPRIGQEVLVGFLEGDPDQPIIVGRVFNAVQQVPYKLPVNKTVSGWKTNSSPGSDGYNEIKLEDRKNLELIYIQAQRNLDKLVKHDETERTLRHHHGTVVGNQDLVIKLNQKELIEGDDHLHVKASTPSRSEAPPDPALLAAAARAREILAPRLGRLYAVLDAARDERILELCRESVDQSKSLYEGVKGEALADAAPYLVALEPGSGLLDRLLEGWGRSFGVFAVSERPFKAVRRHLRRFLLVEDDETGGRMYFRFYDPRVLREFMPLATPRQRDDLFGEIDAFFAEGEGGELLRFDQER
jgi:hypothetical protein